MFTKYNTTHNGFARGARLLTTLVLIMSLAALISPASSMAAKPTPQQAAGIMKVHVTNYQHGNDLAGAWVYAYSSPTQPEFIGQTDKYGIAKLKVPAGMYLVTVHIASMQEPYEPWSQYVNVAPDVSNPVEARLLFSAEMYPVKFAAIDPVSLGGIGDATVRIYDNYGQTIAQGVTNKYGFFVGKAPEGTFIATVLHPKYEAHKDFVKVTLGQSTSTTVGLAPLGEPTLGDMQIHAIDAYTGAPIQGATLTLHNTMGKVIDQGMTDATGTYYTCLPDGKYKVEVTAPKYITYYGVHQITLGALTHYKVVLVPFMGQ